VDDGLVQGDKIGASNCMPPITRYMRKKLHANLISSLLELPFATRGHRWIVSLLEMTAVLIDGML
jgi:hypothetical protein